MYCKCEGLDSEVHIEYESNNEQQKTNKAMSKQASNLFWDPSASAIFLRRVDVVTRIRELSATPINESADKLLNSWRMVRNSFKYWIVDCSTRKRS